MPSETVPSAAPRLSPLLLLVQNTTTQKKPSRTESKNATEQGRPETYAQRRTDTDAGNVIGMRFTCQ